jgi:hypothetical protein
MKQIAILSLVVLLFCACKQAPPTDGAAEGATAPVVTKDGDDSEAGHLTDEGDVEQAVCIEVELHPDSLSESSIKMEESRDALERQRQLTLDVSTPFPEHLWLSYRVVCRENFADRPVAFRFRVLAQTGRGDQRKEWDLGAFALVLGANAKKNGFEGKIDALAGSESVPETMLVKVLAEAHLMPEGADESTVDPQTATADDPADKTSAFPYLAPVRINFLAKEPAGE